MSNIEGATPAPPARSAEPKRSPLAMGRRFARQGGNYTTVVLWLLRHAFEGQRARVVAIAFFSLAFVGSQAAAIATLYGYAQLLQNDGSLVIPMLGIDMAARQDIGLLALAICTSAIFFIAGTGFQFLSRTTGIRVMEVTNKRGLEALVQNFSSLPDAKAPVASRLAVEEGIGKLSLGSRLAGITAYYFSNAVPAVIGGVGAAWFLAWLEPLLTLVIVIAAVLWAVLLYPITLRAVWFANQREKRTVAFKNEVKGLLAAGTPLADTTDMKTTGPLAYAFGGRRRVINEMMFVVNIGITIIVSVALFYVVMQMMSGSSQWPILIAYAGALRLTLSGMLQAVQAYARVSRFYPELVPYVLFMRDAEESTRKRYGEVIADSTVLLSCLDGREISVEPGSVVALATRDAQQWLQLVLIQARSSTNGLPLQTWTDGEGQPDGSLVLLDADGVTDSARPDLLSKIDNSVVFIVHRSAAQIGGFGETYVMVAEDGAITGFARLETPEGRDLIRAFEVTKASKKAPKNAGLDMEEEYI